MNSSRGSRMASFGSAIWIYLLSSLSKLRAEAAQVGSIGQELAQHERPGKLRRPICEDEHLEARHAGEGERGAPGGPHATGEPCQPGGAPQHDQGVEAHVQHQLPKRRSRRRVDHERLAAAAAAARSVAVAQREALQPPARAQDGRHAGAAEPQGSTAPAP